MAEQQTLTDRLRSDILNGSFAPGERLVELHMTERYAVGRAAVREALVELESEHLIEREANRGATVRAISIEEVIQLTEARAALESLAARHAARNGDDAFRAECTETMHQMEVAVGRNDVETYSSLNRYLHRRIREVSDHLIAKSLIDNLRNRSAHHNYRLAFRPGRPDQSVMEHQEIVDAIVNRDEDEAAAAMERHLQSAIDAFKMWAESESAQTVEQGGTTQRTASAPLAS